MTRSSSAQVRPRGVGSIASAEPSTAPGSNRCWLGDPVSGQPFPVAVGDDGRLIARSETAPHAPVAVISIPKAGTYMVGRLLERLGLVDTELHVSSTFLTDYRGLSVEEKRDGDYAARTRHLPITVSAGLVGPGQFIVGHLPCEPWVAQAVAGLRRLFLLRDLVEAGLSHMRFWSEGPRAADTDWARMAPSPEQALAFLRDRGERLFEDLYRPMLGWAQHEGTQPVRFEALLGDLGDLARERALHAMLTHVGIVRPDVAEVLVRQVLGRPTKTLSTHRTRVAPYLDDAVRRAFANLGVNEMNAALGYPPV